MLGQAWRSCSAGMVVASLLFPSRMSIPILGSMERMPPGRYSPSIEQRDDPQPGSVETRGIAMVVGWIVFLFGTFVIIASVMNAVDAAGGTPGGWVFLLILPVVGVCLAFGAIVLGLAYSLSRDAKAKDTPPAPPRPSPEPEPGRSGHQE